MKKNIGKENNNCRNFQKWEDKSLNEREEEQTSQYLHSQQKKEGEQVIFKKSERKLIKHIYPQKEKQVFSFVKI